MGVIHPLQLQGALDAEQSVNGDIQAQDHRNNALNQRGIDDHDSADGGSHDAQEQSQESASLPVLAAVEAHNGKDTVEQQNGAEGIADDIHDNGGPQDEYDAQNQVEDGEKDKADRHIFQTFFHNKTTFLQCYRLGACQPLHTSIQPTLLDSWASSSQLSLTAEAALPAAG